ncbi:DUF4097 family beta strand repeat-containing protein [Enterococcus sp. BWT-B8]|uniref:DUF4097 family beta strand repeat-containing protein n=1 Tax=Enterococcus sp. BWT-B8 TaxID=2885157 RepID=UPI001E315B2C|nr:DUF4097 family beta strand repeat-containing protein [Enterococcus sp. BWT-B8]MCB5953376.1 DUF4097 family beta strand repeat-containing protein [Enterococcus sp. BWT-B8]
MKKKMLLIVICVAVLGVFIFNYVSEDKISVNKEWDLTSEQVKNITLKGISQDIDIYIEKSDRNHLSIEGQMPVSFAEKLSTLNPNEQEICLDFSTSIGLSVAKLSGDKLRMTIYVTDEKNLEQLLVQMNKGNVNVNVPETFAKAYKLKTNQGKVNQPDQQKATQGLIKVELGFGDITVKEI